MIDRLILIAFFSATTTFLFGQKFYDTLHTEAGRAYDCSFDYYNVDSLNKVFFGSKNVRMLIDSTAKYQVMFSESKSWCNGPNCNIQFLLLDTLVSEKIGNEEEFLHSTIPRKKCYHCSKTYNGVDLIKNAELTFKDSVFSDFPWLRNNWDEYNRAWTVFSNEEYVVFRFVYIYIGNTSHYEEKLIYFRKIQ